ncbi:uncharacterized protein LOC118242934 [Electrophorus electricus]|uniref:uncharacterized protein LOC118242934 n=1 Tax=Electrophorus electricus TaxID=8005 RepID=UPI0015D0BF52|nr:uncharacterized protein LOC118242934 [Electrophorus electricus]
MILKADLTKDLVSSILGIFGNMGIRTSMLQLLYLWVVISVCGCIPFIQGQNEINELEQHFQHTEQVQSTNEQERLQRKLLLKDDVQSKILNATNPKVAVDSNSGNWTILVGVLLSVLSVAFLIVLLVKFRVFHRYLGGYRDALLPEEDAVSQFSHIGTIAENFPDCSLSDREAYSRGRDDDDDGFIEDNYIDSSKRYTAEEQVEKESDDELDIQFSIE